MLRRIAILSSGYLLLAHVAHAEKQIHCAAVM